MSLPQEEIEVLKPHKATAGRRARPRLLESKAVGEEEGVNGCCHNPRRGRQRKHKNRGAGALHTDDYRGLRGARGGTRGGI